MGIETIDIRLLGPLEVRATAGGAGPLPLGGPRQRTLLGLLALRAPDVVATHQLVDGIWDERPPPSATRTLHAHVAYLRRTLAGAGLPRTVVTRPPGYVLAADAERVDAHRFRRMVRHGRTALESGAVAEAAGTLREALRLWRGEVLADCPVGEWVRAEAAGLREARWYATEDLLAAQLTLGEHTAAAAELERLVYEEPLRERLWALLIVALYRSGRQGDALGAYRRARTALAEVLGVEPGTLLRDLEAAVLAGDDHRVRVAWLGGGSTPAAGPGADPDGVPDGELPAPLTNLVGRDAEIAELAPLLDDRRLVTLTGVGGCGKTRLAIAVAGGVAARGGGVRFVDLTPVGRGERLPAAMAAALGLRVPAGDTALATLVRRLRDPRLLLVVDNCEHVAAACAEVIGTLLARCPRLRVLATSREPLHLPGETTWPVPPLSVPEPDAAARLADVRDHGAVRLFLDRAAVPAVRRLTDADAPLLARVCAGLDGLPLAIELAAARTSVLSLAEIAGRIREPGLLRGATGAGRPHHGALEDTMAWSYGLLEPAARARFRRLAVCVGGFTREAAQALWSGTGDQVIDGLAELVARSLVIMEPHPAGTRYRLLETIRHYAWERLARSPDELDAARRAHALHFRGLAEGVDRGQLIRLAADQDNLLAALDWHAAREPGPDELRFATALAGFFHLRGRYREGRRRLEHALARCAGAEPAPTAHALLSVAYLALFECDYPAATGYGERALALHRELGNRPESARALSLLAAVHRERGSYDTSRALCREAVTVYTRVSNEAGVADALQADGFAAWLAGDLADAERLVAAALKRFQLLGDQEGIGSARVHLAAVAHYLGEPARARWLAEDALSRFRQLGFAEGIAWALNIIGLVARDDPPRAVEALRESLASHIAVGDRWRAASVLEALAAVLAPASPVLAPLPSSPAVPLPPAAPSPVLAPSSPAFAAFSPSPAAPSPSSPPTLAASSPVPAPSSPPTLAASSPSPAVPARSSPSPAASSPVPAPSSPPMLAASSPVPGPSSASSPVPAPSSPSPAASLPVPAPSSPPMLAASSPVLVPSSPALAAELIAAAAAIRDAIGAPVPPQERAARDAAVAAVREALDDSDYYAAHARGEALALSDLPARLRQLPGL